MTDRLRVLHILNELMPSGAENMLRVAGRKFAAAGLELHVLSTGQQIGPYAPQLAEAGYVVHHRPFVKTPTFFWSLVRFVKANHFDVVHLHAERGFFWYVLSLRLAGVTRLVRTVHNNFSFSGLLRIRRLGGRRVAQWLGVRFASIAPSVDMNERRRFGVTPTLIPNWFDGDRFALPTKAQMASARAALALDADQFAVLTVGNCSKTKNHTLLLEALGQTRDLPWVYLHVGNEDPGQTELALSKALGIADRVHFLGPRTDVGQLLCAADLFVMPSRYEGMSVAALEALGTATPCLFTEVPGLVDLRTFVDGVHYAACDVAPFAASLRDLISAGRASIRGAAPLATAERVHALFGVDQGVQAYVRLYRAGCPVSREVAA